MDPVKQRPREHGREARVHDGIQGNEVQRSDRHAQDAVGSKCPLRPGFAFVTPREQQGDRLLAQTTCRVLERRRGRAVEPLDVVDRNEQRRSPRQRAEDAQQAGGNGPAVGSPTTAVLEEKRDFQRPPLRRRQLAQGSRQLFPEQVGKARERELCFALARPRS